MVCRITTFAFESVEAQPVDVQVQLTGGQPNFSIVGLGDKAVAESREWVRAALAALGLAIALSILAIMGVIPSDLLEGHAAIGELSLDGRLGETLGVPPAAMAAEAMDLKLLCPAPCGAEDAWAGGSVLAAASLIALINHFSGRAVIGSPPPGALAEPPAGPDMRDVKGQEGAKRVLEIAAAGGHNLLFCGPPGSGTSMLAQRLPGLLPPLSARELLEVSQIQSIAGLLERGRLSRTRPFRAPHHSASMAAIVGGGIKAKPGEVSLAHHGILFLDELPEFPAHVLDSLRQPLEAGEAVVARANRHTRYPARFQLVAAMNPCRCGGGPGAAACTKGPRCAQTYQSRLSGSFLDRIDLYHDTPPVTAVDLALPPSAEGAAEVKARVLRARDVQTERFGETECDTRRPVNADAPTGDIERVAAPDALGAALLAAAAVKLQLTARGYHRVLKVARTIVDLDGAGGVRRLHIAQALTYRRCAPGQAEGVQAGALAR
ncbi:YifB family Mg chelatase-like AAA ATPase [Hyphomonas sp.]|jgi:magnesium chelatase family protein|uniref:YifB family Mg chelatase-like AAA ATPase n=1 Tax=Hyphomonas sp. TaxID=87 RepID=UPI0039E61CBC